MSRRKNGQKRSKQRKEEKKKSNKPKKKKKRKKKRKKEKAGIRLKPELGLVIVITVEDYFSLRLFLSLWCELLMTYCSVLEKEERKMKK